MQSLRRILFLIGLVLMLLAGWVTAAFQTQPDIDPLFITATYIVAEATGTAINTSTPTPTFSPEEIVHEAVTYKQQLVDQMGFTHPVLDQIAQDYVSCIVNRYSIKHIPIEIHSTVFNESEYVVVSIPMPHNGYCYDRLLFFRFEDGNPLLLDAPTHYREIYANDFVYIPEAFADRNRNGLPDLPVITANIGTCCPARLDLFEIDLDGNLVNIAPTPMDMIYPSFLEDRDGDGIWEIYGVRERIGPYDGYCCILQRWWGWNGTAYVDSSAQQFDFYMPRIKAFFNDLDQSDECPIADYRFKQILFDYYAMGKLAQAHRDIVSHFKVNNCSVEQLKTYHNLFFRFDLWLQWSKPDGPF